MLREDQIERYSRQILLPNCGGIGQRNLLDARVSVDLTQPNAVGIVAIAYLAAAGVGSIAIAGGQRALVRQEIDYGFLLESGDLGRPCLAALQQRVGDRNPDVTIVATADCLHTCDAHVANSACAITSLHEALHEAGALTVTILNQIAGRR